jgi:hypothetical protein
VLKTAFGGGRWLGVDVRSANLKKKKREKKKKKKKKSKEDIKQRKPRQRITVLYRCEKEKS